MSSNSSQFDKAIDPAEQVITRNVVLQRELVKQCLLRRTLLAHHRRILLFRGGLNQPITTTATRTLSTESAENSQLADVR